MGSREVVGQMLDYAANAVFESTDPNGRHVYRCGEAFIRSVTPRVFRPLLGQRKPIFAPPAARRSAAMRGLDMQTRMGDAEASGVSWVEGLGTAR